MPVANGQWKFTLCDHVILAADQATGIVTSHDVTEPNVMRQAAEERNPLSNEHRDTRDDETLNESRAQELLNRDSSVDVEVLSAAGGELRNDLSRRSGHLFDHASAGCRQVGEVTTQGAATQDHYALAT